MNLLNVKVKHSKFGIGAIVNVKNDNLIDVKFSNGEIKMFKYPNSFLEKLYFVDNDKLNKQVILDYKEINRKEEEKIRREKENKLNNSPYNHTAYHEAAHAILFEMFVPHSIESVNILPTPKKHMRGYVSLKPRYLFSREISIYGEIIANLAGFAAEELVFGIISKLRINPLVQPTSEGDLSRVSYLLEQAYQQESPYFNGILQKHLTEKQIKKMSKTGKKLVVMKDLYETTKEFIYKNGGLLDYVAMELLWSKNMILYSGQLYNIMSRFQKNF